MYVLKRLNVGFGRFRQSFLDVFDSRKGGSEKILRSEKCSYSGDWGKIKKIKKRFVSGFALRRCCRDGCTQTSLLPSSTAATTALHADKTQ